MKKKEKIILWGSAVLLLGVIIGVSYAAFTFGQSGKNLNTVTTGIMQMSYEETSNVIKMTGALPTTDATGKVRLNEGEYFDFTVSSTIQGEAEINWEIAAEDFSSNTFDGKNVKLYLTSLDGNNNETEVMAPKVFTKKTTENKKTGRPANMMSLATGTMSASTSTKYRLRMYVDEKYNPQGDGGNKKFAVRINVYGKVYEEPTGSQMQSVKLARYSDMITKIETKNTNEVPSTAFASFDISEAGDGSVMAYLEADGTAVIAGKGGIIAPASLYNAFSSLKKVISIDLTYLDTSKVTDMTHMFSGCSNLTSIDVSNFDTSKVTGMNSMFCDCSSLTSLDVSNFDTSKVTTMNSMFNGCSSLTSLDVSNFNTSEVLQMQDMFSGCSNLISLDLSNFDTSKVTNMNRIFYNCSKMQSIKVSWNWKIRSDCDTSDMFTNCGVSSVTRV